MTQEEFIKRYTFNIRTDKVGGGSFGSVYKAYDTVLDREVAIKVSEVKYIDGKEFSLRQEYNAIKNLPDHPYIANYETVYTFENVAGIFDYAVMQYYPLGNLSEYLKKNKLIDTNKEKLLERILDGIAHLHEHKVLHRDIKPGNILVVDRAGEIIPKITDFGLSKQTEQKDQNTRFSNSFAGGTLQYSSPEQLKGEPLKLNTDLWSYGVIAYEVLTDKTLFEAKSHSTASAEWQNEVTQQILNNDLEIPLAVLPIAWKAKIKVCLERDLTKRVQSVTALKNLNKKLKEDTIVSKEETPVVTNTKETLVKEKPKTIPFEENKSEGAIETGPLAGKPKPFYKQKKIVWGFAVLLFLIVSVISVLYIHDVVLPKRNFENLVEKAAIQYENKQYDEALVSYKKAKSLKLISTSHPVSLKIKELEEILADEGTLMKNKKADVVPDSGFNVSVKVTEEEAAVLEKTLGAKEVLTLAPVSLYKKGTGYLNKKGEIVIPYKYNSAREFYENRAAVKLNNKWGYINGIGNEVITPKYDRVGLFSEGLAHVELNKKHGFINKQGNIVIPLIYEDARYKFSEGLASLKLNGKWGFINAKGETIIPFKYTNTWVFSEGLAAVELNGKTGFINRNGNTVIDFKYDDVYTSFSEGLVKISLNRKYGYLNTLGQTIIPFIYNSANHFSEGLAAVKLNTKWGYINKNGKEIIPFKYDSAKDFSEGLAYISLNQYQLDRKKGYINKKGEIVLPMDKYQFGYPFSEGRARFRRNNRKEGHIDKNGNITTPTLYYNVMDFRNTTE